MFSMNQLLAQLHESVGSGERSMTELARLAGCSRQHLYGVMDGKHQLSLQMAEKLAAAVGCELCFRKNRKKVSA